MKIGFIVNPRAGTHHNAYEEVSALAGKLVAQGHTITLHKTQGPGDATVMARNLVQQGYDVIASAGGDGTANETAQGVMDSDSAFTIIPYGSGNGLARGLAIPLKPSTAVQGIPNGKVRRIDVGQLTDGSQERLFFGFAGIGYDAYIGRLFNQRKGRRGLLPYVYLSLTAYNGYAPVALTLKTDDVLYSGKPFILAIANTDEYGNGARIAPNAVPDDGAFDISMIQSMSFVKGLLNGWRLFNGTIDKVKDVVSLRVQEAEVIPSGKIYYHMDGEARETNNTLRFKILPGRLKVLVPN